MGFEQVFPFFLVELKIFKTFKPVDKYMFKIISKNILTATVSNSYNIKTNLSKSINFYSPWNFLKAYSSDDFRKNRKELIRLNSLYINKISFILHEINVRYHSGVKWCLFGILIANIYLFKGNTRNTRKRCEICSKLTIKNTRMT